MMRYISLLPTLVFALLVLVKPIAARASASGYVRASGSYLSQSDSSVYDQTRALIDVGSGSVTENGWTIGLLYGYEKDSGGENKTGSSNSVSRSSIGPTFGWTSKKEMGPFILGTYFLSSTRSDGYSGSGMQLDTGYKMAVGSVELALQLSYKRFSYNKLSGASTAAFNQSFFDPYFGLWFSF